MTTPFWCLIAAAILPYVIAGTGARLRIQQLGGLDNEHPRVQALKLRDSAARAYAAQQNAWEALALITAAVMVAHFAGADAEASAIAAIVFVIARVLHWGFYVSNVVPLRTLSFLTGAVCCLTLFGLAVRA